MLIVLAFLSEDETYPYWVHQNTPSMLEQNFDPKMNMGRDFFH